jgi:hypothetical protein
MRYLFLIACLFLMSCSTDKDNFYKTNHTEDIDVLPLIKPYRLWSPIPGQSVWHLDFKGKVKDKFGLGTQTNVCEINVVNRIIYGHCSERSQYPNFYFVIIPGENVEKAFDSKEAWTEYLREHQVDSEKLYDVLQVYNDFKKDYKSLPWLNQVKDR